MVIVTFIGVLFSYNLLLFRRECLKVGLDLQESLNFVTNNSLTGIFFILKMGVLVQVEVITTTMECCIAYLYCLFFRSSPLQKECEAKKTKGCNKGGVSQVQ